ncbi:MAG TPA: ATP-binding protein [Bryobacteraceae bacterium]|nr:ATP-binding protein [Bryobacteraceae bacterium]
MSLRIRLVLLSVTLVALVALTLSALHFESLVDSTSAAVLERSETANEQITSFLLDRIQKGVKDYPAPKTDAETQALVYQIISNDPDLPTMLVQTLAHSKYILEINVASASGQILASSLPTKVGTAMTPFRSFDGWRTKPEASRLMDFITSRPDYQVVSKASRAGQNDPIFQVQVVTSNALLRQSLSDQLGRLALVSGVSLLVTLLITVLAANYVLRPVKRIEETIDRIAQGTYRAEQGGRGLAKEFAIVESKLNLLGQQFRGAREDANELRHNVDTLLEKMASQLDVASRLAAISKLTSGVAHEIKNPLNAIALRLDLLRSKLGGSEEELLREIDVLSKEVLRLDRVVKTFLDFSKPVEVHFEDADLSALAKEIVDLMAPQAKAARIMMRLETPPQPACFRADTDMLKQAILNLISNAMEAMKNGGDLRLKVDRRDGAVSLEIADSGPGIPEELRDKVFQLYFTTKTKGSGIGLALTYRAVQLHNGTIAFTSEEGRGTTFRLQFPAVVGHA